MPTKKRIRIRKPQVAGPSATRRERIAKVKTDLSKYVSGGQNRG